MSSLRDHFQLLSGYNRAANERLLEACGRVSLETLLAESAAPFGSIAGLLEHVLAADEVWLARFQGDLSAQLRTGPRQGFDLAEFSRSRTAMDDRIEAFVKGLSDADLEQPLKYTNSSGVRIDGPLSRLLAHMFNHQTHHRGQVQVLLRGAGVVGVVLDLHRLTVS